VPVAPDGAGGNGEAGESPALSRNCKDRELTRSPSQDARLSRALQTFALKGLVR
jgi:hypothetical protein